MSLTETVIQLRREDCLTSHTSFLLGGLLCCKHYHSRARSHHWPIPGGKMLVKQPGSYRIFCTLTLGSCPGPSQSCKVDCGPERASGEEGGCGWMCTGGGETCLDSGPVSAGWEGEDFWLLRGAITAPSKVRNSIWCLSLAGELFYLFEVLSTVGHINSSYR